MPRYSLRNLLMITSCLSVVAGVFAVFRSLDDYEPLERPKTFAASILFLVLMIAALLAAIITYLGRARYGLIIVAALVILFLASLLLPAIQ